MAAQRGEGPSIEFRKKDAYEFLLRFLCGVESPNQGEYNVVEQFRKAWDGFKSSSSQCVPEFRSLVENITADTNYIRSQFIEPHYKPTDFHIAAKHIADVKKGDIALIVADKPDRTVRIAHALGKFNSSPAGEIWVTSSTPEVLATNMEALHEVKKTIHPAIREISFKEALDHGIAKANHVFVGITANSNRLAEKSIIHAWQKRAASTGNIIHLLDDIPCVGSNIWADSHINNLTTTHQIKERLAEEIQANSAVMTETAKICHITALAREKGLNAGKVRNAITEGKNETDDTLDAIIEKLLVVQNKNRPANLPGH